jgi:DNA adenine methylase
LISAITRVCHPIPYQGSKRALAKTILAHAPDDIHRLVEPFAGSAAISLAAAQGNLARRFWINDAHAPLVALWQEIVERPESLARRYRRLWQAQLGSERAYFVEVRRRFNKSQRPEDFLYLLARCVKAAVRYNARGEFNNAPDNRRLGARPDEMQRRILAASGLLMGITRFSASDYRDVLRECTEKDFVYLDPPYQGVSQARDSRYAPRVDRDELIAELAELNRRGCRYALSYDGRTGGKRHGQPLPRSLELRRLELAAGRSSQATLLGRRDVTYESLYLSPGLKLGLT